MLPSHRASYQTFVDCLAWLAKPPKCAHYILVRYCPGGEIGRRSGLKIRGPETVIRVRVPSRAPHIMNIIFITSLLIFIVSFFLYVNEVINSRVGRYTTWKQLTRSQWVFVIGSLQFPVIALILLISRII